MDKTSPFVIFFIASLIIFSCRAQNSRQDILNAHNAARAQVGVVNITWDTTLENYARNFVNGRLADCRLVLSGGRYGENLAQGSGSFTGVDAVNLWLAQRPNYDYGSNRCVGGECRSYTQVVWRDSVRLGCARAQCNNGWWFVSCSYDPAGNIVGRRPY